MVIDADGMTAIPGLIDSHVHVTFGDYTPRQNTVGYLESYVHGGVTTTPTYEELVPGDAEGVLDVDQQQRRPPPVLGGGHHTVAGSPGAGFLGALLVRDAPHRANGPGREVGRERQVGADAGHGPACRAAGGGRAAAGPETPPAHPQ